MKQIWIVGLAKDCAKSIEANHKLFSSSLTNYALNFIFIVSELDSPTYEKVCQLSTLKANVHVLREEEFYVAEGSVRTHRLAMLRDGYIGYLKSRVVDGDMLIVVDWDVTIRRFEPSELLDTDNDNFAIAANSSPRYYDVFALRLLKDDNLFLKFEFLSRHGRNKVAQLREIAHKQSLMSRCTKRRAVRSAFGGLVVYPAGVVHHGKYASEETKQGICEHVSFHDSLSGKLKIIYIEPNLIVEAPREHICISNIFSKFALLALILLPDRIVLAISRGVKGFLNVIR